MPPHEYPSHANDAALVAPLLELHRAMDLDALWAACIHLVDAALPNFHLIAALPFEGMAPMPSAPLCRSRTSRHSGCG